MNNPHVIIQITEEIPPISEDKAHLEYIKKREQQKAYSLRFGFR
jgi:hypothetical protein